MFEPTGVTINTHTTLWNETLANVLWNENGSTKLTPTFQYRAKCDLRLGSWMSLSLISPAQFFLSCFLELKFAIVVIMFCWAVHALFCVATVKQRSFQKPAFSAIICRVQARFSLFMVSLTFHFVVIRRFCYFLSCLIYAPRSVANIKHAERASDNF